LADVFKIPFRNIFPNPLLNVKVIKVQLFKEIGLVAVKELLVKPLLAGIQSTPLFVDTNIPLPSVPVNIVEVDELTEGPASTVWLTKPYLNPDLPVVVANSDQYIDADLSGFYDRVSDPGYANVILCMEDSDQKWSYVRQSSEGLVEEVREKEVISNLATVGIYGFGSATVMLEAFQEMFSAKDSTLGEYYVAPSYNYIIKRGHPVSVVNLGPVGTVMHGLGIPVDFESFLEKPVSRQAVARIQNIPER
jgi:NDP-sugar pyrophosphorylase family protein